MKGSRPLYDFLIVGAGLFGAVWARLAIDAGYSCLVVDRRRHAGGNLRCERMEGIDVHTYGPHIFHTSNAEVWRFMQGHARFNSYINHPEAIGPDGRRYHLPFNLLTFGELWGVKTPEEAACRLEEQRRLGRRMVEQAGGNPDAPANLEQQALVMAGPDIYRTLVSGYTAKQWGRPCAQLPAFIIKRLPMRLTANCNYFNDTWQGIPEGGYNSLVDSLLQGADLRLGCDFLKARAELSSLARTVVYTGELDAWFGHSLGRLEWRSLRFSTRIEPVADWQGNAVVNHTSAQVPYTRTVEHKHFAVENPSLLSLPHTVITEEHPLQWQPGMEPFYPVNDPANEALAARYRQMAQAEPGVVFGGRLASYAYLDMAPTVEAAMQAFRNFISEGRR